MMGAVSLNRKGLRLPPSLPCEDPAGKGPSANYQESFASASALILDVPASGTVRNKYLPFKLPSL